MSGAEMSNKMIIPLQFGHPTTHGCLAHLTDGHNTRVPVSCQNMSGCQSFAAVRIEHPLTGCSGDRMRKIVVMRKYLLWLTLSQMEPNVTPVNMQCWSSCQPCVDGRGLCILNWKPWDVSKWLSIPCSIPIQMQCVTFHQYQLIEISALTTEWCCCIWAFSSRNYSIPFCVIWLHLLTYCTTNCYAKCTKELLHSAEARQVILMKTPTSF